MPKFLKRPSQRLHFILKFLKSFKLQVEWDGRCVQNGLLKFTFRIEEMIQLGRAFVLNAVPSSIQTHQILNPEPAKSGP